MCPFNLIKGKMNPKIHTKRLRIKRGKKMYLCMGGI